MKFALTITLFFLLVPIYSKGQQNLSKVVYSPELPEIKGRPHNLNRNKTRNELICKLINSGKVLNNHEFKSFLEQISVDVQLDTSYSLKVFNSNQSGVFIDSKGVIYVTTGLISRIGNKEQLYFFLYRQLARTQLPIDRKSKRYFNSSSYEQMLKDVLFEPFDLTIELDKKGADFFLKNGGTLEVLHSCFELVKNDHQPYVDKPVPTNFFDVDGIVYPPNYLPFDDVVIDSILLNTKYYTEKVRTIQMRKEALALYGYTDVEYSSEDMVQLQATQRARIEYIKQAILNGDFEVALYCLYHLEQELINLNQINLLYCRAWTGLSMKRDRQILKGVQSRVYLEGVGGTKSMFFFRLRQLNDETILLLAQRKINEHSLKLGSDEKSELVRRTYYSSLVKRREFIIDSINMKCSKVLLDTTLSYERRLLLNYLYELSDSSTLRLVATPFETPMDMSDSLVVYPFVSCVKNGDNKTDKSIQKLNKLISKELMCSGYRMGNTLELSENVISDVKTLLSESFSMDSYMNNPSVVCYDLVTDSLSTRYSAFVFFQSQKRLQLKPYHLVGLLGVTIPFVLTDIILKANQSAYTIIIIDNKLGEVLDVDFSYFNEPLTPRLMNNRIHRSIQKLRR